MTAPLNISPAAAARALWMSEESIEAIPPDQWAKLFGDEGAKQLKLARMGQAKSEAAKELVTRGKISEANLAARGTINEAGRGTEADIMNIRLAGQGNRATAQQNYNTTIASEDIGHQKKANVWNKYTGLLEIPIAIGHQIREDAREKRAEDREIARDNFYTNYETNKALSGNDEQLWAPPSPYRRVP